MHPMDANILPTEGVKQGRIIIHPHSNDVYVFCGHTWHLLTPTSHETPEDAYERAMEGL